MTLIALDFQFMKPISHFQFNIGENNVLNIKFYVARSWCLSGSEVGYNNIGLSKMSIAQSHTWNTSAMANGACRYPGVCTAV